MKNTNKVISEQDKAKQIFKNKRKKHFIYIRNNVLKLSQSEFAIEINKTPELISMIESGKRDVSDDMVRHLYELFNEEYSLNFDYISGESEVIYNRAKDIIDTVNDLFDEEVKRCVLNSLVICLFARNVYDDETIVKALDAIGITGYDSEKLNNLGKKIYKVKLQIKEKLGFDLSNVQLSKRVFQTPAMGEILDENIAREMIAMFKDKNNKLLAEDGS